MTVGLLVKIQKLQQNKIHAMQLSNNHLSFVNVASVTVSLSELAGKGFVDETYTLQPTPGMKGEMGTLRLKSRYQHEIIMPQEEYTSLKEVTFYKRIS